MTDTRPDRDRVKCLIVDDLAENLLALEALLRGDGVEVLAARSGREALELLLVHDVALALVDVQMPEMDGFELAELMRGSERTRGVPIIFVTAGGRDRERVFKGYDSGAVDFLHKPLEPHVLKSKAEVFFRLHRQAAQLARQLRERTETLQLNEMFVAVLGHDLRGPLTAVQAQAQLLARLPDEVPRHAGERLLRSTRWMGRMIEDMLDLTRARIGGGVAIRRERHDLGRLVGAVVADRRSAFPARAIELHTEGDLTGDWDGDRLTQVVSNLVGNAVAHGTPGEPVRVALDGSAADRVVLRVANGGAIPSHFLPHVFDPFRSAREASARSEGLGLGLYIVREIVAAHGGAVSVESEEARGTAFVVVLPRR